MELIVIETLLTNYKKKTKSFDYGIKYLQYRNFRLLNIGTKGRMKVIQERKTLSKRIL